MRDEHDAVDAQGSRIGTTVELGGTYIGLDAQCYLGITGRAQSISADRELVILSHQQIVYLIGRGDKALSQFLLLHSTIFLGIGNDGVHFDRRTLNVSSIAVVGQSRSHHEVDVVSHVGEDIADVERRTVVLGIKLTELHIAVAPHLSVEVVLGRDDTCCRNNGILNLTRRAVYLAAHRLDTSLTFGLDDDGT